MTNQHKVPRVVWQGIVDGYGIFRVVVTGIGHPSCECHDTDQMGVDSWSLFTEDPETVEKVFLEAFLEVADTLPKFTPPPSKETT